MNLASFRFTTVFKKQVHHFCCSSAAVVSTGNRLIPVSSNFSSSGGNILAIGKIVRRLIALTGVRKRSGPNELAAEAKKRARLVRRNAGVPRKIKEVSSN